MKNKTSHRPAGEKASKPAKQPYAAPKLREFGKVHLATGGPSVTGMSDGSSGMAMN